MSDNTSIEWTDATWSPIRARYLEIQNDGSGKERIGWHCEHVSEGCRNCYAERINRRLGTGLDFKPGELYCEDQKGYSNGEVRLFLDEKMLMAPLRWKKPRMIFVCSMTDLFAEFVSDEWIDRVFAVMAMCPQHTFQVLTKRAPRMRDYFHRPGLYHSILNFADFDLRRRWPELGGIGIGNPATSPLHNVWIGVSAERQQEADERIPLLLGTPAAIRFVSAEPLLGPIDILKSCAIYSEYDRIDWLIAGGESGPNARPMHPDWPRGLRDQCAAAGVAFFFKQWGEWAPIGVCQIEPNRQFETRMIETDGKHIADSAAMSSDFSDRSRYVYRVGKKAAGRLLDGIEHNAMPEVRR